MIVPIVDNYGAGGGGGRRGAGERGGDGKTDSAKAIELQLM